MSRSTSRGLALVVVLLGVLFAAVAAAAPATAVSPPTISSFTPTSGPMRTSVKITGTNFVAPATVTFNNVAASAVTVNSATLITAVVPTTANSGQIRVTTSGGTATSAASFTVTPGSYLSTTSGPPTTKVAVSFSGFAAYEAADVYFDNTDLKLVSASATGSGLTTLSVPATATPGDHYVTVVGRKSGYSTQALFTVRTNWPQFGYDAAHNGENPVESILGAGNVRKLTRTWSSATATNVYNYDNEVVVAGGIVYAVNSTGITAVSASTGATVWSRNLGLVTTTPAITGTTLVIGTVAGHLIGLNSTTGATKYDIDYALKFYFPITIANGLGYAEADDPDSGDTTLFAFDPATGATKWGGGLLSSCYGAVVSGNGVYTTCNNGHLYALRATDGALQFDLDTTYVHFEGVPVVTNGLVITGGYVQGTGADRIVAIDADTGTYAWLTPTTIDLIPHLKLAAADDTVVFRGYDTASSDYRISALSIGGGTPLWTVPDSSGVTEPVTIANGLVYAPYYGYTDVRDLATGARLTQLRGGQFAVVTEAGVYTANGLGTTFARYSLPASVLPAARRPAAATLRPNRTLRAAA